jgi:hypothetical protein
MADQYIDYDETRIYGDYAIEQIARHVLGRVRDYDPALQFVMTALGAATDIVAGHLHSARSADTSLHDALANREAPVRDARDVLQRFAKHLEAHRAGLVPFDRLFVEAPQTLSKRGPIRLLAAVDHVLGSLDEHRATVRDAAWWRDELAAARSALEAVVQTDRRVRSHDVSNETLVRARNHWLTVYNAAKDTVAAVLALSGTTMALDEIFDDLAVTHRAEGAIDGSP